MIASFVAVAILLVLPCNFAIGCPSRWVRYKQSCYLFYRYQMNWLDASLYCREFGANLVTIDGPSENAFLFNHLRNSTFRRHFTTPARRVNLNNWPYPNSEDWSITWIGYSDLSSEGSFLWDETDSSGAYTNWGPGEPNNYLGTEHCAHFGWWLDATQRSSGIWNDARCDLRGTFICELNR